MRNPMVQRPGWHSVALLVCCTTATTVSAATRIVLGDSAATASSSFATPPSDRAAKWAVNGAGLNGNQHTNTPANGTMWMNAYAPPAGQWFKMDLGVVYPLHSLRLWNFNWKPDATHDYTIRGVQQCDLYVSASATDPGGTFPGTWTLVKADHVFAKAPGVATYTNEPPVSLAGYSGRWVALRIDSSHGDASYVGISEIQVFANSAPLVSIGEPTVPSATQATLTGTLQFDGGLPTTVFAHWGTTNGGQSATAWQATTNLGVQATGTLGVTVPVSPDSSYICRYSAVNDDGTNWSTTATFITAPVAVTAPASVGESAGSVVITVTRPAAADDVDLTLGFAVVGGTAVAGQDYLAPTPTVTLPAGSTNAHVSITLLDDTDVEPDKTMVVAVTSGAFLTTDACTNTITLADDDGPLDTTAWSHHMDVVLSGYAGTTALTNFPCAVRLHEGLPGFMYRDFRHPDDGGDLRVTDPTTNMPLVHELDTWDAGGTSIVWVRVPVLTGTNTTVRLHWGNAAGLPGYTTNGVVWSQGFGGVWHLRTPDPVDATWRGNHGTGYLNTTTNGVLGKAQYFNGTSAYVEVPDAPSIGADVRAALTVSMWLSPKVDLGSGDTIRMLEKGDSYFILQYSTGPISALVKTNGTACAVGSTATVPAGAWRHVCAVYDGSRLRAYVDGSEASSLALTGPIDDDHLALRIGSSDDGKYFGGILDEVRIASIARPPDWVRACFDNQRLGSTFAAFGTVEYVPPTVITLR